MAFPCRHVLDCPQGAQTVIPLPRFARVIAAAASMAALAACTQPSGLVNVASSPAEDRSLQTLRDDAAITLDINEALVGKQYSDLFALKPWKPPVHYIR